MSERPEPVPYVTLRARFRRSLRTPDKSPANDDTAGTIHIVTRREYELIPESVLAARAAERFQSGSTTRIVKPS